MNLTDGGGGGRYWDQIFYGLGRQCSAFQIYRYIKPFTDITVYFGINVFNDPGFRQTRNC